MSTPLPPADTQPEAVTGPAANSSPTDRPPDSDTILRVRRLQSDLHVLIRHFACWAESSVLSVPAANGRAVPAGPAPRIALEPHAALLVIAPEVIARDGRLLGQLYESLEILTDLAAPANIKSIRLTRAFVGDADEDLPGDTRSQAQWLFRWTRGTAVFGILVFLATIVLLVHVDRGRRAVQQLEQLRTEHQAVANSLGVARTASSAAGGAAADYDCLQPTAPPAAQRPGAPAEQAGWRGQGQLLCAQMSDALDRMKIIRQELRTWNVISGRLLYASPINWLGPREQGRTNGLSEEEWESSEVRTLILLAALTGFVMPMLLGLLGACVYVFREINQQIQTSTLRTWESIHSTLRMVLGATLGGLLGVIWTNDQPVRLEGVSLPLGALAFFVGFSVEIVFRLVDTLVRTVADRISKPS
jgi:hypothetical protein